MSKDVGEKMTAKNNNRNFKSKYASNYKYN